MKIVRGYSSAKPDMGEAAVGCELSAAPCVVTTAAVCAVEATAFCVITAAACCVVEAAAC